MGNFYWEISNKVIGKMGYLVYSANLKGRDRGWLAQGFWGIVWHIRSFYKKSIRHLRKQEYESGILMFWIEIEYFV